jgi:hypothetical protein
MFALYKLEGARTYRSVREVTVGGILGNYLRQRGQLLPPGFEGGDGMGNQRQRPAASDHETGRSERGIPI